MTEEDRASFEEQWGGDPEIFQELRSVEAELFDGYVRGELTPAVRARVDKHLLNSESQRQKLAFAGRLQGALGQPLRRSVRWWPLTVAATLVAAFGGTTAWLAWQNAGLRTEIGTIARKPPNPLPAPTATFVSLLLQPGTRDARPPATIQQRPPGTAMRIQLALDPGERNRTFSIAVVQTGRTILTLAPIPMEQDGDLPVASFWIGAQLLSPGDYTIRLSSADNAGGAVPVDYYSLRVVQRSP
jgi:hypothetical protein